MIYLILFGCILNRNGYNNRMRENGSFFFRRFNSVHMQTIKRYNSLICGFAKNKINVLKMSVINNFFLFYFFDHEYFMQYTYNS